MPEQVPTFLRVEADRFHGTVTPQRSTEVSQAAVNPGGKRTGIGQHFPGGNPGFKLARLTVHGYGNHAPMLLSYP